MNLKKKKDLAVKVLGVGKERIIFNTQRLDEIKEAITKQDIRDLFDAGAISIKEIKGSKVKKQRKTRRRKGSIRKKVKGTKREYMHLTRNLREYLFQSRRKGEISRETYLKIRKEIKARTFKDKNHLKERIKNG